MRAALLEVHGELQLDGHRVEAAGRTDAAIARDLLALAGLDSGAIDSRADDVITACCALYDELCPPAAQQELLEAIPQARLVEYAGAGHAMHWESPQRFARDLAVFVQNAVPAPDAA